MSKKTIQVTEPHLPPIDDYIEYLRGIWQRNLLSNHGPLVCELEQKIQSYHDIDMAVHCVANGGLGLQIMIKALGIQGEVITTPFSYVATASCPLWEGCSVKFVDIEPDCLTIDPSAVEAAIGPETEAILATHVFGNPCDCDALEKIASKHGIALLYDAAHAFGVRYKGKSILEYGDASMVSMHATKLMHTAEGGFVVARDKSVSDKVEWMRRFGHNGYEAFHGVGINAKMSELHAAMGLCNMQHIESILARREAIHDAYNIALKNNAHLHPLTVREDAKWNYSYYPFLFESEGKLLEVVKAMNQVDIWPRRYFWPLLDILKGTDQSGDLSVCKDVVNRILCLPLSDRINNDDVTLICNHLASA